MNYSNIYEVGSLYYIWYICTAPIPAVKRTGMGTLQMTPSRHRRRLKPGD